MQLHAMFQFGHNGLISMDGTFGTNDVKYHLFTLMAFDYHRTKVPFAWVITSQQTCEGLVE
jgi:phosphatidylserine decarboxylase